MRESALAEAVCQFLAVALPREAFYAHVPNEGKRSYAVAAALQRQGMRAGIPDYLIVYGGRAFWIELKAKRGQLSEAQKQVHRELRNAGCDVLVCRSLTEVQLACETWGIPMAGRIAA